VIGSDDPVDRREPWLREAIPRNPRRGYRGPELLEAIFDTGSVMAYAEYGGGTLTALARLDGHPVGVIAADPRRGVTLTATGAQAVTRLVDICETFHLPLISLTDQAGVSVGLTAEREASLRAGARAIAAVYQARVPQAEVIVRRVYGVGGAGIVNRHRALRSWAWPSADLGSLPAQGGIEAAFRARLAASEDPAAELAQITEALERVASPFSAAERFFIQDLIDPADTRPLLCEWVHDAWGRLGSMLGPAAFGHRP
jgi:acetyl-CoA carboxylase carboxyltransferase component